MQNHADKVIELDALSCVLCREKIHATTDTQVNLCSECGVLLCQICSDNYRGKQCITSDVSWLHTFTRSLVPLKESNYYDPVRTIFKGQDVVLALSWEVIRAERSKLFHLFWSSKSFDIAFSSIRETVAFNEKVQNQYEWYNKQSEIHPIGIELPTLYDLSNSNRVRPNRPSRGNYSNRTDYFCRSPSVDRYSCSCSSGSRTCPNCTGETVVTCPSCSYRSGRCSNCGGTGEITDSNCGGSGRHRRCGGSGRLTCSQCRGSGTIQVSDTEQNYCSSCGGDGRDSYGYYCSRCGGSGIVTRRVYYNVSCPNCGGHGLVRCSGCYGTGTCPVCGGSGKVPDPICGGTGICQTCYGRGVLQCPTCDGDGDVTCPICEGYNGLVGFTYDVYTYEEIIDTKIVLDTYFGEKEREKLQNVVESISRGYLTLKNLKEESLRRSVGIINNLMDQERKKAIQANSELHSIAKNREFQNSVDDDSSLQTNLLKNIESNLRSSWSSTTSDSYYSKFKLSLSSSERKRQTDRYYGKRLFYTDLHYCFPITSTTFSRADKVEAEDPVISIGTFSNFEFIPPKKFLEFKKIFSFLCFIVFAGLAIYLYVNDRFLIYRFSRIFSFRLLVTYQRLAVLSIFFLLLFIFFAWWTYHKWHEDIILVVGNDETAKLRFTYLLGEFILQNDGNILDQIFNEMKENSLSTRTVYGSSLAFRASVQGRRYKVININRSAILNNASQVDWIVGEAAYIFSVVNLHLENSNGEVKKLESLISDKPHKWVLSTYVEEVDDLSDPVFISLHNLTDLLVGKSEKEHQMAKIGELIGMECDSYDI